jgi:hypothetical protein
MAINKLNNLNVELAIASFSDALGNDFDKIVNDIKSMLGRLPEKDLIAKQGEWKAGAKFKLTSKEGYAIQLPPNSPATVLLCFGMRLNELQEAGGFEAQADIPKNCQDWVNQHRKAAAPVAA